MKFLVARIAALQPDLVLIEKTVSRLAQEFLLAEGITFAYNIKPKVINRIARATGCDVLTSATDNWLNPTLGLSDKFYVKTYQGDWGLKPLMFFDGCPKNFGCSILLRGAPLSVLKQVKKITSVGSLYLRPLIC